MAEDSDATFMHQRLGVAEGANSALTAVLLAENARLRAAIEGSDGRISVQGFLKRCEPYLRDDFNYAAREISARLDKALEPTS